MVNENLLKIKKQSEISEDDSGLFSKVEFSEVKLLEVEKFLTVESLKTKLLKIRDNLKKMDEIIEDLKNRLHISNGELDEFVGI